MEALNNTEIRISRNKIGYIEYDFRERIQDNEKASNIVKWVYSGCN